MTSDQMIRIVAGSFGMGVALSALGWYQHWKAQRRNITMRRKPDGTYEDGIILWERRAIWAYRVGVALIVVSGLYLLGWYY